MKKTINHRHRLQKKPAFLFTFIFLFIFFLKNEIKEININAHLIIKIIINHLILIKTILLKKNAFLCLDIKGMMLDLVDLLGLLAHILES